MALRDNSDSACIYCLTDRKPTADLSIDIFHHALPHAYARSCTASARSQTTHYSHLHACTPFYIYVYNYYCYYLTAHRTGYKKYININIPFQACRRANRVFMGICSVRKCVQTDVHTDVHTGLGELICSTEPKQISI